MLNVESNKSLLVQFYFYDRQSCRRSLEQISYTYVGAGLPAVLKLSPNFNGSLERITSLLSPLTSNRRRLSTRSPPRSNTRYQRPLNSKQFYCKMQQWVMSVRTADCYHSEWRKRRHDRLQRGFASVCFYIVLCKIYYVFLIYQTVHIWLRTYGNWTITLQQTLQLNESEFLLYNVMTHNKTSCFLFTSSCNSHYFQIMMRYFDMLGIPVNICLLVCCVGFQ